MVYEVPVFSPLDWETIMFFHVWGLSAHETSATDMNIANAIFPERVLSLFFIIVLGLVRQQIYTHFCLEKKM